MKPKKVYIAGPYSQGVTAENIRNAVFAAERLVQLDCSPYIPHLSHLWELIQPHCYEFWIHHDMEWLGVCDALLRLPGHSPGADGEVAEAQRLGIPVFYSLDELKAWIDNRD